MNIISKKEIQTFIREDGTEQSTTKETTSKIEHSTEPDYIKVYTKMWCEFNQIPMVYRDLFFELICNMSYCNASDLEHSQLVNTGKPWSDSIMKHLGWKKAMYQRGLAELCKCNAIKKISRGVYQINPSYAGRGEWKYNPRLSRGGIENLIATFDYAAGRVETKMLWADNGEDTELNELYRTGLNVTKNDNTTLTTQTITPEDKTA
jgi:hypothetical protein